jgi:hypothetical protein
MKTTAHLLCLTTVLVVSGVPLQAEEADADFKHAVGQLYKVWMEGNIFTCAYRVRERELKDGKVTRELQSEMRLTLDPSTQHFIFEMHRKPEAMNPRGSFSFYRWNGKVMMLGTSNDARLVKVGGRAAVNLEDVPLGTPLCDKATLYGGLLNCNAVEAAKQAIGFALDGKMVHVQLEELLRDPKAQLMHLPDTPADDISLTVGDRRVIFDARRGLMKGFEINTGRHLTWTVEKFVDKIPAHMVLKLAEYGATPEQEAVCEAIDGQCRRMDSGEFENLLDAALPGNMEIIDMATRRVRPLQVLPQGPLPKK